MITFTAFSIPIWPTVLVTCFLLSMLALSLIYSKFHSAFKGITIALTLGVFFLAYASVSRSTGWPDKLNSLPELYKIVWIDVKEPNNLDDPGAIYVWTREANQTKQGFLFVHKDPKIYSTPYTKTKAKDAEEIKRLLEAGKLVYGSNSNKTDDSSGKPSETGADTEESGQKVEGGEQSELTIDASNHLNYKIIDPNEGLPPK